MILIYGALLGFISVAFGAYAEHGLRESITDEQFRFIMTAIRYNQVNAAVITAIGLSMLNGGKLATVSWLKWSGVLFIIGTVLFCFSIYFSVWLDMQALVNLAPIGGMTMMGAWLLLIATGLAARKNR